MDFWKSRDDKFEDHHMGANANRVLIGGSKFKKAEAYATVQ